MKSKIYIKKNISKLLLVFLINLLLSSVALAQVQGVWSSIPANPFVGGGHDQAIAFAIGNKGYYGGGHSCPCLSCGGNCYKDFWEYDQATSTWTQKTDLPTQGRDGLAFSIGSKGYVIGFGCGTSPSVYEYDQLTDTWTTKNNYPGPSVGEGCVFVIGSNGYIACPNKTKDLWEYNSITDVWTQKANFPGVIRVGEFGFALGSKGYVGGGRNNITGWVYYTDTYSYDPFTNTWSMVAGYPGSTSATIQRNTFGLSMGGYGYVGWENQKLWRYDAVTDSWTQMANKPTSPTIGSYGGVAFATTDALHFGAGSDGTSVCFPNFQKWRECSTSPAQPSAISGSLNICGTTTTTYSIPLVPNAGSYTWMLPGGWSGTSTTNIIPVTVGPSGGIITVIANNSCGASTSQTLAVTVGAPSTPTSISGSSVVCSTSYVFSTTPVPGATSYSWTKPTGWSGTSTSTAITVSTNTTSSLSGNITVSAVNACGVSTPTTYYVYVGVPPQPTAISGNNIICSGSINNYSISTVGYATSYTWTLPSGSSGSSTTNSINVTSGSTSGIISVGAKNACGTSSLQTYSVTVNTIPTTPASISGPFNICSSASNLTYTTPVVSGATSYSWTLPGGWTGSSTTNTIIGNPGTSGNFQVRAVNSCGISSPQNYSVTVNISPTVSAAASNSAICSGNSIVLTGSGASTYTWLPGSLNSSTVSVSPTSNTTYTLIGSNGSCTNTSNAIVNVTTTPVANAGTSQTIICASPTVSLTGSGVSTYTWSGPGIVSGSNSASPVVNASGTYSLVGSTSGCTSNISTVIVSTNTIAPSVSVTATSNSICIGNSATLTASGASTYSWSTSSTATSIVVSPTTTTVYNVSGTNTINGCTNTTNKSITVNLLPIVTANTSNSIICGPPFQGTATITASGASTYTWNTTATTTAIAVSPSITTNYTVIGTDANGCLNSTSFTQSVSACTAISEQNSNSELNIYPNPTSGVVTIKAKAGLQIHVYNIIGELILSTELKNETIELDLSNQANGIYLIRIGSDTRKIIKE